MYTVYRTETPLNGSIDGTLLSAAWQRAPKSSNFVDMATGAPAIFNTSAAALWDDTHFYAGFWVEDPYPRAQLTERDSIIFLENDVELFIDGGDSYYELELNALGTIYEVFFIWRDAMRRGGKFDVPEFDLLERDVFGFAGDFDRTPETFWRGTHPRGPRWAFLDYDMPGLQVKTHVDGWLNNDSRKSLGWTAEIAIPWESMKHLANGRSLPPQDGDIWRMFFGRFQNLLTADRKTQAAWCLTPHGKYDTHMPEQFTPLQFSTKTISQASKR